MTEPKFEFDWNEEVVVANDAPAKFGPSKTGAVVGMRVIENEMQASPAGVPIGTVLYLIEYADGNSVEVPASFLRRADL
jgi:hypothetical protein